MKLYSIKKQVMARNPVEALNNEAKAEITDLWVEEENNDVKVGCSAIGFEVQQEDY